jgi:YVTN family beta-propeller protein
MKIPSVLRRPICTACLVLTFQAGIAIGQDGFVNWETPHVSPLSLTGSGSVLLAVNTADNRLEIFDVVNGMPVHRGSVAVGLNPVSVRARSSTEAWVVNRLSDSISIVDLPTMRVTRTILTGDDPADVVFASTAAGQRAFVTLSQPNQMRVYDAANPAATPTTLAIAGEQPRALTVSADGTRVFAAIFESGNATGAIRESDVSSASSPYAGRNPPPNSGNTFDPPIVGGLTQPPTVAQLVRRMSDGTWRDDNNRNWSSFVTWNVLDHDVAIINTSTLGVTYADSMMTNIMGIATMPNGHVAIVGTESLNHIRFEPNLAGVFATVNIAEFDPGSPTTTRLVGDLNPHLTYTSSSVPEATRNLSIGDPRGIVFHPVSGLAYVSGMGSNNVVVCTSTGARVANIPVGEGPTGLAISPDGSRLFVLNKFDASISVVDTAARAEVSRTPMYDPTPSAIKEGRPLLYDTHLTSGLGQVSCATCHIDGRTDALAWDLGNPAGTMKAMNQPCRTATCRPWNPMKGPMITQTLQGIVGNGAMHWRGDRENVAAFSDTFRALQGTATAPDAASMSKLEAFIGSIIYGPNPNLNIDNSMATSVITSAGSGSPSNGLTVYTTRNVIGPTTTCIACHALPKGTDKRIDDPAGLQPQPLKIAQLRGLWERGGWNRTSATNTKLFGFNHNSEFDTLNALLSVGFNFGGNNIAPQLKRDVEAFLLSFTSDTHAGAGQQVTFFGANNTDGTAVARLNTFVTIASQGTAGLVAKGRVGGIDRGYYYNAGIMSSDRAGESLTVTQLRGLAATGGEITFTLVPAGTQHRIGVDRDADGFLDRDEIDFGSDPADQSSVPANVCWGDFNMDGGINGDDIAAYFAAWEAGMPWADVNGDGGIDGNDLAAWFALWEGGQCS